MNGLKTAGFALALAFLALPPPPPAQAEEGFYEKIQSELRKRAQGLGESQKRACAAAFEKQGDLKNVVLTRWEQNLKLTTYADAGGWPARGSNPRYHTTLLIMNVAYKSDATWGGVGEGVCIFNREAGKLVFIIACSKGRMCNLQ